MDSKPKAIPKKYNSSKKSSAGSVKTQYKYGRDTKSSKQHIQYTRFMCVYKDNRT